jgi:hypothetical protein
MILAASYIVMKCYNNFYESFQINPTKISLITYGNENYKRAKERIWREAEEMGCFNGGITLYGPENLSDEFKKATKGVIDQGRGGGYWIWKPFVIMDALSKANENDIVVYADSGCTLHKSGLSRFNEYIDMISWSTGKSILAMKLRDHTDKEYTSTEIFDYFHQPVDGKVGNSNQVIATCAFFRKSPDSMAIVNQWLSIATTRPELFTDRYNEESKRTNPEFKDNRHDQSIFSMILKTDPNRISVIIDEEIEGKPGPTKPIHASRKT